MRGVVDMGRPRGAIVIRRVAAISQHMLAQLSCVSATALRKSFDSNQSKPIYFCIKKVFAQIKWNPCVYNILSAEKFWLKSSQLYCTFRNEALLWLHKSQYSWQHCCLQCCKACASLLFDSTLYMLYLFKNNIMKSYWNNRWCIYTFVDEKSEFQVKKK